MSDVTRILEAAQQGDPTAAEELLPLVYEELHRLATHKMAIEATMNTNAPELTPKARGLFHPGEVKLACGLVFLALTMALFHFVMGLFLAVVPALFAGLCVTDGVTRARNGSAPAGRQWAGIALVLLAVAALVVVAFTAASLSYKLQGLSVWRGITS